MPPAKRTHAQFPVKDNIILALKRRRQRVEETGLKMLPRSLGVALMVEGRKKAKSVTVLRRTTQPYAHPRKTANEIHTFQHTSIRPERGCVLGPGLRE